MLAPCTTYFHNMWTLWGLWIFGQYRFWVGQFVTPRRGRLHGGATFSWYYFTPKNMSFLVNRQSLDTWTSHDFSRLAHKRETYYCQPPQMDQPITSFKTLIFSVHSNSLDIKALYHWVAFTGSFLCQYTNHFKGATSLGRHTCPYFNQVIETNFVFSW